MNQEAMRKDRVFAESRLLLFVECQIDVNSRGKTFPPRNLRSIQGKE
jgi:hypothetical protein